MHIRRLRALAVRLIGLFSREKRERELAEELESHLQLHTEDNLRAGMTPQEARRQAILKLGGVEPTKENYRSQGGLPLIETLVRDLRYGLRRLTKSLGFTTVAVLSLALGIGANTAIFSLVNTLILRPLPVENPEELVSLSNVVENRAFPAFSYPNYKDFHDRNDVLESLIAYRFAPLSLSHDGVNERLWGYVVTGNYFEVLGVKAALGRMISPDDDRLPGAHPVAVISYEGWQKRFGADPAIIGKSLIVNGLSYTVIGVAPKGFFGTEIIAAPELWFPMAMQAQIEVGNSWLDKRGTEYLFVQGRLKPGVSMAQAQTALNSIALQLEKEYPDVNEGKRVMLWPPGFMSGVMRSALLGFTGLLMVVVAFVLLLACTNLANLLLAQATERRKEIAVRLALGASRLRLVRQLMAESMLLAIFSGAFGLLLAYWLVGLAVGFKPPIDVPLLIDLHMDYRVLIFTCLISLATGLLFGLLPALQATKVDLLSALKDETSFGNTRRSWWKSSLIVLQVALSLVLLVGGGLMLRALQRAQTINLGFNPQNAVEVSFDLRLQGYTDARGRDFQKRLLERVRVLPVVQSAGIVDLPPVDLHFSRGAVFIEGQPPERAANAPRAMTSRASPGYFKAMGTRLVQGRDFTEQDDEQAPPVAIVNETFARRFWPNQDPLGKRFSLGAPDSPMMQVVGVVQDGKYAGLNEAPQPYVCRPLLQSYVGTNTVIARADTDPQKLLAVVRNEVQQLDPNLPLASARPLSERMALPLLPARVAASIFSVFGLLALVLAAIGIYGVMSYAVSRRTHEIGIRVALGAQASDVLRLVIGQGMMTVMIGVGIGLSAALLVTRLMKSLLFGVSATDPLTYVGVAALLTCVALLACYIPARRATRIDPMIALRNE
ncbi:MAG TPA: ABC transporter permease [Pyrinomonadaceae bacterium]|jgi:predicted permease|nr:ABC transporter permease [Pyrinomonadaceae bacterium]